ncbi:Ref family recombination enhancement nuclease [Stenotrophomonas sp. 1278]|uniref:Ref family recombination enhancement nuclease n=1 Tax=Stenotrophomonas sp. 1278 TaxID=2940566 RepID=UPI0024740F28|nr:Ref family recombination enhancement nuclease [Stenotrophomonas sp. 1278]
MWSNAPAPTRAEAERIRVAKRGPCMVCLLLFMRNLLPEHRVIRGCEYHHCKSGNIRRGHAFGFAMCEWHHERKPLQGKSFQWMSRVYGWSLKEGSRTFHDLYGSDDELIDQQTYINELRLKHDRIQAIYG